VNRFFHVTVVAVVGCWRGSVQARCKFARGPAGTTATHCFLLQEIQIGFGFTFLVSAHSSSSRQNPDSRKTVIAVVVVVNYSGKIKHFSFFKKKFINYFSATVQQAYSILEYFEHFCQMTSKSILIISSYTVQSLDVFLRHGVLATTYVVAIINNKHIKDLMSYLCLQCFDAAGWVEGRASGL